jgi:hypothetical protein
VLDQAATIFAKDFYDKLLEGESPRFSFESAIKSIRLHFRTLACCCQHKKLHAAGCPWNKKLSENMKNYRLYGKFENGN